MPIILDVNAHAMQVRRTAPHAPPVRIKRSARSAVVPDTAPLAHVEDQPTTALTACAHAASST